MVFVIHWHESAMDLHVFPIPIPPPTSLSTRSLWVFPVHQARALVSCIMVYTLNHYALVSGYFLLSTSPVLPHPPALPPHTPYFSSFLFKATGAESSVQIYCLWLKIQREQEVSWANICKGIRNNHVFDLQAKIFLQSPSLNIAWRRT